MTINQRPEFPLFLFEQEICERDGAFFGGAGFNLYSFIERASYLDLGWVGDETSDFTVVDRVLRTNAERVPRGYFLPRIHVWAPDWWKQRHPEELVGYALDDAKGGGFAAAQDFKNQSFASELWKREAGEALRRLVRHILDGPYADRVLGIHIAAGAGGEWHQFAPEGLPDTSEPMQRAFTQYVKNKYHEDVDQLRVAWNAPAVGFSEITIPMAVERRTADLGIFRDPAQGRKVIDYYECYHGVTVAAIDYFCGIVKQESQGRLLTFVLYGYVPDMPYLPQEVHHRAPAAIADSPHVDVLASPHSYWNRGLGQSGGLRHYTESLALHGKLFVDEGDDRTHLADPEAYGYHAKTSEESVAVLERAFGNAVTHGAGIWFMDQSSGRWYDDPAIRSCFVNLKKWADFSMTLPRQSVAEVALISSAASEFYLASLTDFTSGFYEGPQGQMDELCRSGAAIDKYLIEDLAAGRVPPHKVYLFIDCFYLTATQRAAIEALKNNGHTLVFYYATGYVTDAGLSPESMESLIGISFTQQNQGVAEVVLEPGVVATGRQRFGAPDATGFDANWIATFAANALSPRFVPSAADASLWGRYGDTKEPGLVCKDFGSWRSVYCPRTPLPSALLRKIFADAGVHIYCGSDDNISANRSWVVIHAANSGMKRILLDRPAAVYDILNDKAISENTTEIVFQLDSGRTGIFAIKESVQSPKTE